MLQRCEWCQNTFDEYVRYHDEEWGVPVHDDQTHFEFLILEGAQAGLSWSTILKRREGYREAFAHFDVEQVARFDEKKVQKLLKDSSIIRNELKIRSAISNARLFMDIQDEFESFSNYVWKFVGGSPIQNNREISDQVPAKTQESEALAADLKNRGFKFIGPTIMYAHMQATGLVNDHLVSCFRYEELKDSLT